jgi:hypothetical protein
LETRARRALSFSLGVLPGGLDAGLGEERVDGRCGDAQRARSDAVGLDATGGDHAVECLVREAQLLARLRLREKAASRCGVSGNSGHVCHHSRVQIDPGTRFNHLGVVVSAIASSALYDAWLEGLHRDASKKTVIDCLRCDYAELVEAVCQAPGPMTDDDRYIAMLQDRLRRDLEAGRESHGLAENIARLTRARAARLAAAAPRARSRAAMRARVVLSKLHTQSTKFVGTIGMAPGLLHSLQHGGALPSHLASAYSLDMVGGTAASGGAAWLRGSPSPFHLATKSSFQRQKDEAIYAPLTFSALPFGFVPGPLFR